MTAQPLRVIVLGAQRKGVENPLAARFGTSHKCLVPLRGKPLIAHVLATLARHARVGEIVVSAEPEVHGDIARIAAAHGASAKVRCTASADNLADSVIAASRGRDMPTIITTADHALLAPASIDAVAEGLEAGDAVMAFAREDTVRAAHPEGQRRFYQFRDGGYSNCNLYGIARRDALCAAEIFRGGGQFAKKAQRIVAAFGFVNLLLLRLKLVTMEGGLRRISRRAGLRIVPVVLDDGSQAIDVDNDRTYRVVEEILARQPERDEARYKAA